MGASHPVVVHFAIALTVAGVGFRLLSLTRRFAFANAAAMILVLAGTVACFAAVQTGTDAHRPVEQMPGLRAAVQDHEWWAIHVRLLFSIAAPLEVVALTLYLRQHRAAFATACAAAAVGALGVAAVLITADRGGTLVYAYAGGIGIRSGNTEDVTRLFVAGAYQQALQDRAAGRNTEAMTLLELAAARAPANLDLRLLVAEWTTDVKKDPAAALVQLDALTIPPTETRSRVRAGLARANALVAQGNRDGARAVLQTMLGEFPGRADVTRRLAEVSGATDPATR